MKITLAQISPKLNRSNLDEICKIIKKNSNYSDLIVFPELSLNGYLLQDKLYEDAWDLNELDELKILSLDVDIAIGGAIRDKKSFRNSALYFSKGKLLSSHNKVHLPNYGMFEEARYFKAGDKFESFLSSYGKVFMLICEDLWHESVQNDLKLENPDLIIVLVASPARGFSDKGLEIENQWLSIIKTVSNEDLRTGELKRLATNECHFRYRDSIFKGELLTCAVITAVGLKLRKHWEPVISYGPLRTFEKGCVTAKQIFDCICNMRNTKLPNPNLLGNAGSFFKNPVVSRVVFDSLVENHPGIVGFPIDEDSVKLAAGWLIDRAGLKGLKVGDAAVHEEQALVLVNKGHATGTDVTRLAMKVISAIVERYGIKLAAEPRIIGANGEKELADD